MQTPHLLHIWFLNWYQFSNVTVMDMILISVMNFIKLNGFIFKLSIDSIWNESRLHHFLFSFSLKKVEFTRVEYSWVKCDSNEFYFNFGAKFQTGNENLYENFFSTSFMLLICVYHIFALKLYEMNEIQWYCEFKNLIDKIIVTFKKFIDTFQISFGNIQWE